MKTLPVSGALALAVIAAAIALAAAFAGSGKASASEYADDCTPVQLTPEIVWGGLLVVPNLDGEHNPSNPTPECQRADCIASGGKCGGCTDVVGQRQLVSTTWNGNIRVRLWSQATTTTCGCGYHRTVTRTWYTR